jgi:rhamnose utilization protein RhaD (predicted bifunctional aldolase and dehydrogenase)
MIESLLKSVSPEVLAAVVKSNPDIVIAMLQRTGLFTTIGQALNTNQQICISTNINRIEDYFKTREGKSSLSMMANEFAEFVK